jgi:hypothetical protein
MPAFHEKWEAMQIPMAAARTYLSGQGERENTPSGRHLGRFGERAAMIPGDLAAPAVGWLARSRVIELIETASGKLQRSLRKPVE